MKYILGCFIFFNSIVLTSAAKIDSNSSSKDELLKRGHQHSHAGDFAKAKKYFSLALKKDPSFQAAKLSLIAVEKDLRFQQFQESLPCECIKKDATDEELSKCVKEFFVYKGKPLSVKMIFDMVPWLSDRGSQVLTLDIENSFKSNRYFEGDDSSIERKSEWFKVVLNDKKDDTTYSYDVIGKTSSGVFVVKIINSPNRASGVFAELLFLKIEHEPNFQFSQSSASDKTIGKLSGKRLVLKKLGDYPLGNRTESEINIRGNTIEIRMQNHLENESTSHLIELEE